MAGYYELVSKKNNYLNKLIESYWKDPKEGKESFILLYLRNSTVFMINEFCTYPYEIDGKHIYPLDTYVDCDEEHLNIYEEISVDRALERIQKQVDAGEYKVDYIQINTPHGKPFLFTMDEYYEYDAGLSVKRLLDETWVNNNKKTYQYFKLPSWLLWDTKNRCKKCFEETKIKTKQLKYKNIDLDIKPKELVVIGGRPTMGKTTLSINIAINEAKKGGNVLYMSLEYPTKLLARKILGVKAEMSINNAIRGSFNNDEYNRAIEALNDLGKIEIIDCNYYNIKEIETAITNCPFKPTMVIIDYYQLLHYKYKYPTDTDEIHIANRLKALARRTKCSIVVNSQVSRVIESRNNKRPRLKDLTSANKLGEIADKVFMLYREAYYNDHHDSNEEVLEINELKSRQIGYYSYYREIGVIENDQEDIL